MIVTVDERLRHGHSRSRVDLWRLVGGRCSRRIPGVELAGTFAVSTVAVWVSSAWLESSLVIPVIRIASVLFAAAAATCLEDPNAEVLDTAPFGRFRRRSLAVGVTAVSTLALWSIVVLGAAIITRDASTGGIPIAGLAIELIAICIFGWLVAAALLRWAASRGTGSRAATVVVVGSLLTLGHPRSIEWLWAAPGPTWRATHEHWAMVGVASAIGLITLSRDPSRRKASASKRSSRRAGFDERDGGGRTPWPFGRTAGDPRT